MMSTENNIDYPEDDIGTNWCIMMINASPGRGDAKQLSAQRPWEKGELDVDLQKKKGESDEYKYIYFKQKICLYCCSINIFWCSL